MASPMTERRTSRTEEDPLKLLMKLGTEEAAGETDSWLGTGVVAPLDAMKAQVKKNLLRPRYNVADYYHEDGLFQAIARSSVFEAFTLFVIALNAVWVAIDTDLNDAQVLIEAHPLFQIVDFAFCTYFSLELFVRFMAFKQKRDCCRDGWFLFDAVLVALMVAETWAINIVMLAVGGVGVGIPADAYILRVARLMRLPRMARVVRLLRAVPELVILVKGMMAATRSVCCTLALLGVLLYVFAITLRQLADGTEAGEKFFPSVPKSMYTLLIHATFLDFLGLFVEDVGKDSTLCVVLIWVFVLFAPLTVLNMLIGILCEVVTAVASIEKEANIVSFTKEKMGRLFYALDESGDGLISREEFFSLVQKPETARLLTEVGVDVVALIDEADEIFTGGQMNEDGEQEEERQLTFPDLMEVVLEARGSSHVSVKHIVDLRKQVLAAVAQTNRNLSRLEAAFRADQSPRGLSPRSTGALDEPPPARGRAGTPEASPPAPDRRAAASGQQPAGASPPPALPPRWGPPPAGSLAPLAPGVRDPGGGWRLVERLEGILLEAREEIRRELGCTACAGAGAAAGRAPERHRFNNSSEVVSQAGCVVGAADWSELREKLASIRPTSFDGAPDLRGSCTEVPEEGPGQPPEPRRCTLMMPGV